MIPPEHNAEFVYRMERILDIYHRPYDPLHPIVCMDESPNQLIAEVNQPYRASNGELRTDYEYERKGTVSIFMANEPLDGKRIVRIKDTHKTADWVDFMEEIYNAYPHARLITVVLDNLSTHKPAAFYEYFPPEKAHQMLEKFEFVFTPTHGSWLNIAEIELNTLKGQCLNRRIESKEKMILQVQAWEEDRNQKEARIDWQFSTNEARIKLKRLYPKIST